MIYGLPGRIEGYALDKDPRAASGQSFNYANDPPSEDCTRIGIIHQGRINGISVFEFIKDDPYYPMARLYPEDFPFIKQEPLTIIIGAVYMARVGGRFWPVHVTEQQDDTWLATPQGSQECRRLTRASFRYQCNSSGEYIPQKTGEPHGKA